MLSQNSFPAERNYSPLYFLASLGAGGITVTFFMYLLFWVPHPGRPVPVVADIMQAFINYGSVMQGTIILALAGIALFGFLNLRLLVWNLRALSQFMASAKGQALSESSAQTQVMAMPLALAMSVNVLFILGLVFVPKLWSVVEFMFPAAILCFLIIGGIALRQMGQYLGRVISSGGFDARQNNSLSQLLPAFTFAMVGVGLAAPGAMSGEALTAGISIILSSFFLVASLAVMLVKSVLGISAMLRHGVALEQAPTLLIIIPILTVLSILIMRQDHGLHVHFGVHGGPGETMAFLTRVLSLQILFLLLGVTILKATGYLKRFIWGQEISAGSYTLICPAVALQVLSFFWINKGLVKAGVIDAFGPAYWILTALAIGFQVLAIVLVVLLNRRHFARQGSAVTSPQKSG